MYSKNKWVSDALSNIHVDIDVNWLLFKLKCVFIIPLNEASSIAVIWLYCNSNAVRFGNSLNTHVVILVNKLLLKDKCCNVVNHAKVSGSISTNILSLIYRYVKLGILLNIQVSTEIISLSSK